MKLALAAVLALVASTTFAQSSTSTIVNGTGINFTATALQDVGGQTLTLTFGNGAPRLTQAPSTSPAGVSTGSFSAGLSIGAILGGGFGSTGGTSGSQAGLGTLSLP
ncbi:hypothetical protein [Paraburkholderia silvatlantica]|uniref:hypothetical protein n=1 Tax=Paraburkholderia silvatlantica TaxID=321895 RepID=UPI0037508535